MGGERQTTSAVVDTTSAVVDTAAPSTTSILWETATDWNNAVSESGVVHESTTNTDHDDATIVTQGYPYGSFDLITPTPVSVYPLHEDSGSTANDLAGTNDGTINGATIGETGILNTSAYSFDGSDDNVDLGADTFDLGAGSISVWFNFDAISSNNTHRLVSLEGMADIVNNKSGNTEVRIYDGSSQTAVVDSSPSTGTWYHVVSTWDGSTLTGYLDGSSIDSTSAGNAQFSNFNRDNRIGAKYDDTQHVSATIAEVRIYDTALSSSEVSTLYDVVDTAGSLETGTKSFSNSQTPDLVADVTLNGVTSFDVDVIGSPSGTSETNTVTVNSTGTNTYSITWSNSHTDFRVRPKPANGGDVTVSTTINTLELQA